MVGRARRALRLRPREDLRLRPRAHRRRPRGRRGRARRPARAQRRGQVDAREDRLRAGHADRRHRRGVRRARRLGRGAPRSSATSPSCSASPTGARATSCSSCTRSSPAPRAARPSAAELLELVGLADARRAPDRDDVKGMQQRLGLAQALIGAPRMLLLDEPTSALDPAGRRTVRALLEELRGRGVSVLLNSHLLSEVELVCDRVAIIAARRGGGRRHAGRALARRRGGGRDRRAARACSADAAPRGRAADRARAGGGGRGGLRRARAHLDAGGRVSRGGGRADEPGPDHRRASRCASRCAGGCSSSSRCSPSRSSASTRSAPGSCSSELDKDELDAAGRASSTDRGGARRCSGWRCSRRSSSAPCSPSSSRSARSAATPSAGCCSRCSCGRSTRRTLLLGRYAAAAAVCAAYVIAVFLAAAVITWIIGDWWPDRIVVPGARARRSAVAIIAALSLAGSVVPVRDRQRDRGLHGLRRGPGRRAARPDRRGARLRHAAERRQRHELAAARSRASTRRRSPA